LKPSFKLGPYFLLLFNTNKQANVKKIYLRSSLKFSHGIWNQISNSIQTNCTQNKSPLTIFLFFYFFYQKTICNLCFWINYLVSGTNYNGLFEFFFVERKWDMGILFSSGAMPSSHSSLCTALTASMAI
jgi:Divergent PAP2 family